MTKKIQKRTKPDKSAKPATKRAKAAAQVAPAKKTNPPKPPGKVYVLFGADEYAKPRAARFSAEDPDLLAKAAEAMHLRLVEVTGDDAPQAHREPTAQDLPGTWDDVAPGHVVLAREILECGWWEAVVIERTGDFVTVRYRDYPKYRPMVRHRSAVALISAPAP
jgi:hypothetical protein